MPETILDGPGIVERIGGADPPSRRRSGRRRGLEGRHERPAAQEDGPWDTNPAELAEWQRDDDRAQARAAFDVVEAEVVLRDQHTRMLADALGRVRGRGGVLQPTVPGGGAGRPPGPGL